MNPRYTNPKININNTKAKMVELVRAKNNNNNFNNYYYFCYQ